MLEKAKRLAENGERVAIIIAHDNEDNMGRNGGMQLSEENHFLFQSMSYDLEHIKNISLELVSIWDVRERVHDLISQRIHVFVDEFSFASPSASEKIKRPGRACGKKGYEVRR